MRRRRWFARVVVVVCSVAALGLGARSAGRGRAPETRPARMVLARAGLGREDTFVSLVPACGCARRTELEAFSTITGRLTRRLGSVKISPVAAVDAPAVQAGGRLLITVSTGWRCAARGSYAECPRIKPDSCTNEVLKDIPAQGGPQVAFTIPGRFEINDAVPSPNGRLIAFAQTPCTSENGPTGLFVRGRPPLATDGFCSAAATPATRSTGPGGIRPVADSCSFTTTRTLPQRGVQSEVFEGAHRRATRSSSPAPARTPGPIASRTTADAHTQPPRLTVRACSPSKDASGAAARASSAPETETPISSN